MTQTVAVCALILFAIVMIGIGISCRKSASTMDGFLIGSRRIGPWMSAFAYGTTYFSAVIFVGYSGKFGWDIGFAGMWIGVGNAFLGCLLAWLVLAKRTRVMTHALGASTMPEFFGARYDSTPIRAFSALIIFIFLVPYSAAVYKGLGSMFGVIFPGLVNNPFGLSPSVVCMLIVAILTAIYLILGGYVATAVTDFVQGIIMIIGVITMVTVVVSNPVVGGLFEGIKKLTAISPGLTSVYGGTISNFKFLAINIMLTSFGTWGLPQMVNKFYAIKDESSIKKAMVVSTCFAFIIGCGAYFVGVFGRLFLNNTLPAGGYDAVVPQLLLKALSGSLLTNILLSVILLLLLSASMSTLSSIILTSSSAISVDLLKVAVPEVGKAKQMLFTKILCFVFIAMSFIFATFNFAIIVSIMSFSWGIVSGCFIGPYLWGLYWKGTTRAGAWSGMIGGVSTVAILTLYATFTSPEITKGFYAAFKAASSNAPIYGVLAMALSVAIVPAVSLLTSKLPEIHTAKAFTVTEK